jgi:imidazolonepropionase-like amidohydrolase
MRPALLTLLAFTAASALAAQVAVRGDTVYTMAGPPIHDGVVVMRDGKIESVGPAAQVKIPAGCRVVQAKVVTPGLIDAHTAVGLTGYLNQPQDQEQLEKSAPIQPELRAIDSYDPDEPLIAYVRSFGVTTMHTGHAPGALISGQTMIVKTRGKTADQAAIVPAAMVAATLGEESLGEQNKSPGTRAKQISMLRDEFIKAKEYLAKQEKPAADNKDAGNKGKPARDLRLEAVGRILKGEMPLLVTAERDRDIVSAIRLGKEFNLRIVLDGAADAPFILDRIKESGYPVILHPTMKRAFGPAENLSFETASKLQTAGIPYALQTSFEGYVPKTRVLVWEAAWAAANGLTFEQALASITINAARLLGIEKRVGSLEAAKDGDLALYDGDPFEYTSHCTGVFIDGQQVSDAVR